MPHAYRLTKESNEQPALLPRAPAPPAPHVRGIAGLLRRGSAFPGGRPGLRLLARVLPGAVPSVSARSQAGLLRLTAPGSPGAAQEVRRSRSCRRAAQTQLLGV